MSLLDTMEFLEENPLNPPKGEKTAENLGDENPKSEIENRKSENPNIQSIDNQLDNFVLSEITQHEKQPSVSTTVTKTDKGNFPTYEKWSEEDANAPWAIYAKKLGIKTPEKPVLDADRQRRLQKYALLNDVGQGLAVLGEMFGLSKGSSVRKREIPQAPQLAQIEQNRREYQNRLEKYPKMLQDYYKLANDYEVARRKRYLDELNTHSEKISTTTTSGGGSVTEKYENEALANVKHKQKKELAYIGKSLKINTKKEEKTHTYPLDADDFYTYQAVKSKEDWVKTGNFVREELENLDIDADIRDRILNSVSKNSFSDRNKWKDVDNSAFVPEAVRGLILYKKRLDKLIKTAEKLTKTDPTRWKNNEMLLRKKRQKVNTILNGIQNTGFNFDY